MRFLDHAWPLVHRARFYANVPEMLRLLKFRALRAGWYDAYWTRTAASIGAETGLWPGGYRWIRRGGLATSVKLYSVALDDHLTVAMLGDKALVLPLLKELGCPVPAFRAFAMSGLAGAAEFGRGRALAVKPASGAGAGRGVTTGVEGSRAFRKAARHAARFSRDLLAEEMVEGGSFRLLYLDGRLIDAIRRDPPRLVGDGRSTIRALIARENASRLAGAPVTALSPLRIDPDLKSALASQDLGLSSRPAAGARFAAKRAVNENTAAEHHSVLDRVHPRTAALGTRVTRALGVKLAGIDLICRDISAPLTRDNGVVGEINTTPGLHHHALVADPAMRVEAGAIVLEYIFAKRLGVMSLGAEPARAEAA